MCKYRKLVCLSPWLLTAILMVCPGIHYVVHDDMILAQIVHETAFGCRFFSLIAGRALYGLAVLAPGVEWFDVWLLASLAAGFGMLHWTALQWRKWSAHVGLWLVQILLTLSVFTFTTVAMVCVFAGAAALVLTQSKHRWPLWLAALLLVFNGCCMRKDGVILCCGGLIAPLAVFNGGFSWKKLSSAAVIAAACMAIWCGIGLLDRALIRTDEVLEEYVEYEAARSGLYDGWQREPDEALLVEAGVSNEDLQLVRYYFHADPDRLDTEWFGNCAALQNETGSLQERLNMMYTRIRNMVYGRDMQVICPLAMALCALALGLERRRTLLCMLGEAIMLGLETLYLIYIDRYIGRVAVAMNLLCVLGVGAAYLFAPVQRSRVVWLRGIAAACLVVVVAMVGRFTVWHHVTSQEAKWRHEQLMDEEELLLSSGAMAYMGDYWVRTASGPDRFTPNLLGDWWLYSPWWRLQMERAGLEDHCDYAFGILLEDGVTLMASDTELDGVEMLKCYMERRDDIEITVEITPMEGIDRTYRCDFTEEKF